MASVKDIIATVQKSMGKQIITVGVDYDVVERIETGVFEFDLATGGGIPKGRITILWGEESSMKTTLALKAIASHQKKYPKESCVFIDVENSYDTAWGAKMGIDNDKLVYVLPDFAEQVVDIVQDILIADDVGVVVIDSLAALITNNEDISSADKAVVGGTGLVIGKLYRKATMSLSRAKRLNKFPTLIAINQVRQKIGVMYGDPSVMPGGNAFKFASSLTVKLRGKNIVDPKIDGKLSAFKQVFGTVQKWKVPITSQSFEYLMATVNNDEYGLNVGIVEDYKSVENHLIDMGLLGKTENGKMWHLFDSEFKTKTAIKKYLKEHPKEYADVKKYITDVLLQKTKIDTDQDVES